MKIHKEVAALFVNYYPIKKTSQHIKLEKKKKI